MAFEEKRRLSQGLGSLAGDKLGVVMEIIAESQHFESVRPLQGHTLAAVILATCSLWFPTAGMCYCGQLYLFYTVPATGSIHTIILPYQALACKL